MTTIIQDRFGVKWELLPSLYGDAWQKFPFEDADEAQEFVNLASSRVRHLASQAPDGTDQAVLKAWNEAMFEELNVIMTFRGRFYLRNWELELPLLIMRVIKISRDHRLSALQKMEAFKKCAGHLEPQDPTACYPDKFPWTATANWPNGQSGQWEVAQDAYRQVIQLTGKAKQLGVSTDMMEEEEKLEATKKALKEGRALTRQLIEDLEDSQREALRVADELRLTMARIKEN